MTTNYRKLTASEVVRNGEQIFHKLRWGFGIVVCPYCGSQHIKEYDGYHYKCNSCKTRFSDRTNTIMHGSKLSVGVWMQGIYEMASDNFISSVTLSKKLGINQKSAWLMQFKLRHYMNFDDIKLTGVISMDEMYIGGCLSNYHYSRKLRLLRERHYLANDRRDYSKNAIFKLNAELKTPVFGMTDGNKVILHVTPNPIQKEHVRRLHRKYCTHGCMTIADESGLYINWERSVGGTLKTNNHNHNQYKTHDGYTSNPIENKFSWFKRGFYSRIIHCKYHQLYLNEFCFRYNHRDMSTEDMFKELIGRTIGKHYTYKQIKEHNPLLDVVTAAALRREKEKEERMMNAIHTALKLHIVDVYPYHGKQYVLSDFE